MRTLLASHDITQQRARRTRMLALATAALLAACARAGSELSAAERAAIGKAVEQRLITACTFRDTNVVARLMSLYADSGAIISASAGTVTTTRAALQRNIQAFWTNIGQNMRDPRWEWTAMHVDVLARDAAVVTATYRIPHITPQGHPHIVGGAWTAVFQRRHGRWVIIQEHLSDAPPIG